MPTKNYLMMHLLQRYYWFDDALNTNLHLQGWPNVSRAQSLVLVHLALGVNRAATIAQNVGVSRQAMSQMLREMQTAGLVEMEPDPDDRRAAVVKFSKKSGAIRESAVAILERLNRTLANRIGADKLRGLHSALEADWGEAPIFDEKAKTSVSSDKTLSAKTKTRKNTSAAPTDASAKSSSRTLTRRRSRVSGV